MKLDLIGTEPGQQSGAMLFVLEEKELNDGLMIVLEDREEERKLNQERQEMTWRKIIWDNFQKDLVDQAKQQSNFNDKPFSDTYQELDVHPYALYQWSTIGSDNRLSNPTSRELLLKGYDLPINDEFELFIALIDNTASIEGAIEDNNSVYNDNFQPLEYEITLTFDESYTDKGLCLNQCSKNGQCLRDDQKSAFPYCECFLGFAGADCSLIVKQIELSET